MRSTLLADGIDRLLPQTQCGKCGYVGCRPYAEAIAAGEADINQCPPGGDEGVRRLAKLLGREPKPLNPANGAPVTVQTLARIEEDRCIGCTLCIQACPVDAIVGANLLMHTVIEGQCTGCELCIPVCPVDCIVMEPVPAEPPVSQWRGLLAERRRANRWRRSYENRQARRLREEQAEREARRRRKEALANAVERQV